MTGGARTPLGPCFRKSGAPTPSLPPALPKAPFLTPGASSASGKPRPGAGPGGGTRNGRMAISEASIPVTSKLFWASRMELSPVPHPISSALQGLMAILVTVSIRLK